MHYIGGFLLEALWDWSCKTMVGAYQMRFGNGWSLCCQSVSLIR